MTPREKWNAEVARTLATWRSVEIASSANDRYNQQLFRSIIAGVIAKSLRTAYDPLFQSLTRIEWAFASVASLASNRDPWEPKEKSMDKTIIADLRRRRPTLPPDAQPHASNLIEQPDGIKTPADLERMRPFMERSARLLHAHVAAR